MSEVYSQLHESVETRLDEGAPAGYGFVLPAPENMFVVPIVPKIAPRQGNRNAA